MPPKKDQKEANAVSDGHNFALGIQGLYSHIQAILKETNGLKSYDQLCHDHQTAKTALEASVKETSNLKEQLVKAATERQQADGNSNQKIKSMQMVYREEMHNLMVSKNELETLRNGSIEQNEKCRLLLQKIEEVENENKDLRKDLEARIKREKEHERAMAKQKIDFQSEELKTKRANNVSEEYKTRNAELTELLGMSYVDVEQMGKEFEKLAKRVEEVAKKFFHRSIDITVDSVELQDGSTTSLSAIPIRKSNLESAQLMRVAFAQAKIGHTLATRVFRLFPIEMAQAIDVSKTQELVEWAESQNAVRASVIRCQILKLWNQIGGLEAVEDVSKCIVQKLSQWLDEDLRKEFAAATRDIVKRAFTYWHTLLLDPRATPIALLDQTPDWQFHGDSRPIYGNVTAEEYNRLSRTIPDIGHPAAVLFPCVELGNEIVFDGYALFRCQKAYLDAGKENETLITTSSARKRRQSDLSRQRGGPSRLGTFDPRMGTATDSLTQPSEILPEGMIKPLLRTNGSIK